MTATIEKMGHHHIDTLKGIFALALGSTTLAISLLEKFEATLRSASLLVSIAVGLVTIWNIVRKWRKK